MTAEDEWQGWCARFDKTHNSVIRLFHDRAIWRTILAMLDANPKVARGSFGEYWLGSCYTDSLLIAIRRETGGDSGSIGLLRSLKALTSNPRMATRSWYVQQVRLGDHQGWDAWALADLDAGFNRYAAPGKSFIEPALVQQYSTALEAMFIASVRSLSERHKITSIRYFGDLDLTGLDIPRLADVPARDRGLPPVRAAEQLYSMLFEFGLDKPSADRSASTERAMRLASWLPPVHQERAISLLMNKRRIAQEWVNRRRLAEQIAWHSDLRQTG